MNSSELPNSSIQRNTNMSLTSFEKKRAGKILRQFINEKYANQKAFAAFVGFSPTAVTGWVTGKAAINIEAVKKLAFWFPEYFPTEKSLLELRPDLKSVDLHEESW